MMCLANISICRTSSSQDMNPWSKNQPNHPRSPFPPTLPTAAPSRWLAPGPPRKWVLDLPHPLDRPFRRWQRGVRIERILCCVLRRAESFPEPEAAEVVLEPGVIGVAQQRHRLGLVAAEVHRAEGAHALTESELAPVLRRHVLVDVAQALEVRRVRHPDPR